ncbi:MAG: hypothetical protein KAX49_18800 [Halanaerobiales bacterium]|nr:hypothetical protein [Halanaerobiales bacterium]
MKKTPDIKQHLITIFWLVAIVLGAFYAWDARYAMNPDGISYLDMGDAYLRGDWNMAINAYWSPFYSWLLGLAMHLLKPSPYWEFSVVHLVNFAIYLCALGCFHFFLLEFIRYHRGQKIEFFKGGDITLPEWAWLVLGYTLFIWSSLKLITISKVTPDMCVAAFIYLASGILLRIRREAGSWFTFILLGVILGFSYLTKTAMFLLSFIFLGVSMFLVGNLRRAMPRVLIALVIFLSIGGPFIVVLSNAKDRLTFGDNGRLAYAWYVNGVAQYQYVHWQGGPPGSGTPRHPTRKLSDKPEIYEFGAPIGGTYPAWYDPSYWHEGVVPHFDLRGQIRVLISNAKSYYHMFFCSLQSGLIIGALVLYFMGCRRWLVVKDIAKHWSLLIPAISALGIYLLIHVQSRYVGAFVVLLWLGIFSGVRLPDSRESKKIVTSVVFAMLLPIMISISLPTAPKVYSAICNLIKDGDASAHVQCQVASALKQMGVEPGDKVAFIGHSFSAYWARLARVRIVAEIPSRDVVNFWAADHLIKSRVIKTFAGTGAKVIVARDIQKCAPTNGWQRIGNTDYYAYILKR